MSGGVTNGARRPSGGGRGTINEPVGQHRLEPGIRTLQGWAISNPPMSSALLRVDGVPVAAARVGLSRPTVAARSKAPVAELCGFEAQADLTAWAQSGAELDVEITRLDGTTYVLGPLTLPGWDPRPDEERVPLWTPSWDVTTPGEGPSRRVLVVSHDLALYGAQRRMLDYLTALSRQPGLELEVLSPSDGPLRDELAALGIPVRISGPDGRQSGPEYERAVEQMAELIAEGGYDAVWANTLVCFGAVDAATRIGVPSFWFIHEGLEPPQFWAPEAAAGMICRHAYERFLAALGSATTVACVARAARRTFQPYRDRTIALVPNSIDLAPIREYRAGHDRTEARARLGFGDLDRLVLSVAPVVPHKGQSVLAQAFAAIAPAHPLTVCVMIGDIGHPYAAGISAYAGKIGLADRIRVLPPVEDIHEWFLAADLFVLPSDEEALASVVLEAMAFDVPVVSTDVVGMPEAVEDGRTGFLCRRRDVASLAEVLDTALSAHPATMRELCAAARERVHRTHDASTQADTLHGLLTALTDPADIWGGEAAPIAEIGLDVALAIARDLVGAGAGGGSVLHVGRGADVGFALAELGFAVTMIAPDVAGGTLADWRRLSRAARNSGAAMPRLRRESSDQHLAAEGSVYDAVLLFAEWPARMGDGVDGLINEFARCSGRAARAYFGVRTADGSAVTAAFERVSNARGRVLQVTHMASSVDLAVGDPIVVHRADLT